MGDAVMPRSRSRRGIVGLVALAVVTSGLGAAAKSVAGPLGLSTIPLTTVFSERASADLAGFTAVRQSDCYDENSETAPPCEARYVDLFPAARSTPDRTRDFDGDHRGDVVQLSIGAAGPTVSVRRGLDGQRLWSWTNKYLVAVVPMRV